ncbi:right-handed parallel beta-helix repeat-containing protein [Carboxylicivirga sp. RSCT41]|uniref:right-handed parallel beta-helix repeat-containing protein n=1 Tax=Carboxylicivirga agarovorans TaxID=3417570 RepID=UPI003D344AF9
MNIKKNYLPFIICLFAFLKLTNLSAQTAELFFVDEHNAITISYGVHQALKLQLTDPDQNTDANSINTVSVTLRSATEPEGELLTLTETGINTGIFTGSMNVDVNPKNNGDELLQVTKGETITASHNDPSNDFGNPETINTIVYYGFTPISGSITTNTNFLKTNSPYLVTGDVTVEQNKTLTIEPGVEIRIMPLSDDQSSGQDINKIEFRISGDIVANGTEAEPIKWIVNSDSPDEADWYGIYLSGEKTHTTFCYNEFEHAYRAIYSSSTYNNSNVNELVIEHNTFQYTSLALYFDYTNIPISVNTNTFKNISNNIIFGKSFRNILSVNNNIFKDSESHGIYINYHSSLDGTGNFHGNSFDNINYDAIHIVYGTTFSIVGNTISNSANGIHLDNYSDDVLIKNNTINNNSKAGIEILHASANIEENTITQNSYGIDLHARSQNPSNITLMHNSITNNWNNGITVGESNNTTYDYVSVIANYNNLYGNSRYSFANYTSNDQNAKYNYWGETTINQINGANNPQDISAIYDQYENSGYGLVNYSNHLPCEGCEPNLITGTGILEFVDNNGLNTLAYKNDNEAILQLSDPDQNTDASAINTVTALVYSTTEPEGETITLTETGIDSGIFKGSITFDESSKNNGDGLLQVTKGEKITATNIDPFDDFNNSVTLTTCAYFDVSLLSGLIDIDYTLEMNNSPYLVTGDVTVEQNKTLTIEPGVEIRIMPLSDDQSSGQDINKIEFRISGDIVANGTEAEPIKWIVNSDSPAEADWYGIYLSGEKTHTTFCYNIFEHAYRAIYSSSTYNNSNTNDLVIEHNTFQYTSLALYFDYTNIPISVNANTFKNISNNIIFGKSFRNILSVNNNIFKDSESHGIYINYHSSLDGTGIFHGNKFTNITYDAIHIVYGTTFSIVGNIISNSANGIHLDNYSEDVLIKNNTIKYNSKAGIEILQASANIEENTITGNSYGVDLHARSQNPSIITLTHNTITNHANNGITVGESNNTNYDYVSVIANYNNLYGNRRYCFANYTSNDQNAKYNYWGETTTDQINSANNPQDLSAIYDEYENSGFGFVNYAFYLDSYSCYQIETTESVSICEGESYSFADQLLTESGEYQHIFTLENGCDSVANLILVVNTVNTTISRDGNTLTAEADNALYQWLEAGTTEGTPIPNETYRSFTPDLEGKYAVSVTQNGCTEISEAFDFSLVPTSSPDISMENKFKVYPNPNSGLITIESIESINNFEVEVFNMLGRKIIMERANSRSLVVNITEFPNGTYIVKITNDGMSMHDTIIKQ